jgi:tetraacyldisaccharide 4'-kinase
VSSFPGHWQRIGPLAIALFPLACLFGAAIAARRFLYRNNLLASQRMPVPVIVVGNLVVGGAGKTPLVIEIVSQLVERGFRPGIVSRGYGGTAGRSGFASVPQGGDPSVFGDEPVVLAQRTGRPVFVGSDRARAAAGLLAAHSDCDVIISDDGLQHYALARDMEIAVEDERGHGNGLLLPAGPLREPATRPVDAVVFNGSADKSRAPSERAASPVHVMAVVPEGFYEVRDPARLMSATELAGKRLHAVAGIGHPERFFRLLEQLGVQAQHHAFPDHHDFRERDLAFPDCDAVVMTEKDAVKCAGFEHLTIYVLKVRGKLDSTFHELVLTRLQRAQDGRTAP